MSADAEAETKTGHPHPQTHAVIADMSQAGGALKQKLTDHPNDR